MDFWPFIIVVSYINVITPFMAGRGPPCRKNPSAQWAREQKKVAKNWLAWNVGYHDFWQMDVSKNRGTPKWMVKIMEHPIKMDELGVPLFSETPKSRTVK